jgi:hypothetical protein
VLGRGFSHYYMCMLLSRFIVVASMSALAITCHPQVAEPPRADPAGELSIRVINRNRIDVIVYVIHQGIRNRLGLATASTTTHFNVPLRLLGAGHEYRLLGDPLGLSITISTETLFGQAGDEVTWQLEDRFAQSTVVVH